MTVSDFPSSCLQSCRTMVARCIECGLCVRECAFLARYGTPRLQAAAVIENNRLSPHVFFCSLCGLCRTVCPKNLDPAAMFLALRIAVHEAGCGNLPAHRSLRFYENRGVSPLFSWYGLPEQCRTVYFPGCAFAGTRPARVLDTFTRLRQREPSLGVVLDCCAKPSLILGDAARFTHLFGQLLAGLRNNGITRVLVNCPTCLDLFHRFGQGLEALTVYEDMVATVPAVTSTTTAGIQVTVHDPCSARQHPRLHAAVRTLVRGMGGDIVEMCHREKQTICCGEGGAVAMVDKELSSGWGVQRCTEAEGRPIITYCAGCTAFLGRMATVIHLADLLAEPRQALQGDSRPSRPPWTYCNRLLLKLRLARMLRPAVAGRRASGGIVHFRLKRREQRF